MNTVPLLFRLTGALLCVICFIAIMQKRTRWDSVGLIYLASNMAFMSTSVFYHVGVLSGSLWALLLFHWGAAVDLHALTALLTYTLLNRKSL